jgi:hypothetical protein
VDETDRLAVLVAQLGRAERRDDEVRGDGRARERLEERQRPGGLLGARGRGALARGSAHGRGAEPSTKEKSAPGASSALSAATLDASLLR